MGDKPGHYWDLREARWVKFSPPAVEVPEQAAPIEDELATAPDDQLPA
jgi:hypothetical protein